MVHLLRPTPLIFIAIIARAFAPPHRLLRRFELLSEVLLVDMLLSPHLALQISLSSPTLSRPRRRYASLIPPSLHITAALLRLYLKTLKPLMHFEDGGQMVVRAWNYHT